jgi:hypothetical protein
MLGDPQQGMIDTPPMSVVAPQSYGIPPIPYMAPTPPAMPAAAPQDDTQSEMPRDVIDNHEIHPTSQPLINAVETGFADKKFMSIKDEIQKAILNSDDDGLKKAHRRLADVIRGEQDFRSMYADIFLGSGATTHANRMAGDVIINELHKAGVGNPRPIPAEEALHMGLIHPQELVPGRQLQESYGVLRPDQPLGDRQSLIPGTNLTPFQQDVVADRRTGIQKGRVHADPAGLTEYMQHLNALERDHFDRTGRQPTAGERAGYIAEARGHYEKGAKPGSLNEDALKANIDKTKADTTNIKERTTTEQTIRPHQVVKFQADATESLAKAKLAMTNASDAVRKGDLQAQHAELERARVSMGEMKSQMQAIAYTLAGTDVTPQDRVKLTDLFLKLAMTGVTIAKRGGLFGSDFFDAGAPNVSVNIEGQPQSRTTPLGPQPDPVDVGFDPGAFAPRLPGTPSPIPSPIKSTEVDLTPEEYAKLRKAGMSAAEIAKKHTVKKGK